MSPTPIPGRDEGFMGRGFYGQHSRHHDDSNTWRHSAFIRRMELPTFDGEEAESWLLRVEEYFELGEPTDEEKLRLVRMSFTGDALLWYRWERDRNPFRNWAQLKFRVLEQYSTLTDISTGERLLSLRQEGTVRDFNRDFISLASNAPEIADPVLEMAYSNGLQPKIRAGVRMFDPQNLREMMKRAKQVEEWSSEETTTTVRSPKPSSGNQQGAGKSTNAGQAQAQVTVKPKTQNTFNPNPQRGGGAKGPTNHGRLKPPFRRLTSAEVEKWKAEGLCFKCDEKFHPNHPCQQPQLTVLLLHPNGVDEPCELLENAEEVVAMVAQVSLNSVVGLASPRTMKLRGSIAGAEVVVLIDSGATHNFISEQLVR